MRITPGTRLGPYEVVSPLGAGGMGEVYRARDTRLGRDVALKILPEAFSSDPDRIARFEREAQVLASLNHPHIAAIYGLERSAQGQALVLELVEGETLADRIARGPMAVDETIAIAMQIAAALAVAHDHGIIHRDLKPANVKLTPAGAAKVLDFGLAKLGAAETVQSAAGSHPLSMSPTITSPAMMTHAGLLLGTAAYMAPEQARGKAVDRRADVWALGCVLFEMLAGRRPFEGSDITEQLAAVIKAEPSWDALPAATPARVRTVLRKCLEKDPAERVRDCGDVMLALGGAFDTPVAPVAPSSRRRVAALAAAAAVLAAIAGAAVWWFARPAAAVPERVQFALMPPDGVRFSEYFVLSPDGRHVAFTASGPNGFPGGWVHTFATGESRPLEAAGVFNSPPFWSPDSRSLGFARLGQLLKIDVSGGPPEVIVDSLVGFAGAAWSTAGTIVYAAQEGLFRVAAAGGSPTAVTALDERRGEFAHGGPWFLPDGQHFLYLRNSGNTANTGIYVGSIDLAPDAQPAARLLATPQSAQFIPARAGMAGQVLFMRGDTAMTVPFDDARLELAGDPVALASGVGIGEAHPFFSVSSTGSVAYRVGGNLGGGRPLWVDRAGRDVAPLAPALRDATFPRISPDGTRVAVVTGGDVWVYHLDGRPPVRITFEGGVYTPLWMPDGERIVYENSRGQLAMMYADGRGGTPEMPFVNGHLHPYAASLDGAHVIASAFGQANTGVDLVVVAPDGKPVQPLVATPTGDGNGGAALSPDGRWLAYMTSVTGEAEIWVRPYGASGAAVRVSPEGGNEPVWSRNGRELYYVERSRIMAVSIDTSAGFRAGPPQPLFEGFIRDSQPPSYDVAANGRFLVKRLEGGAPPSPITIVLNWMPTTAAAR